MRADLALVEQGLCPSRAQAQTLIEQGKVLLRTGFNQQATPVKKASQQVEPFMTLELVNSEATAFVSRGGLKLQHALDHTGVKVNNRKCVDLGQSTGGFTDCLLKNGAASVVGVDVGRDQLHLSLKNNPSVLSLEGINLYKADMEQLLKHISDVRPDFQPFEFAVADLSFISLRKVLPNINQLLPDTCEMIFLVKPQFEVGPEHIGKNGLVRNLESLVSELENNIKDCCAELNWQVKDFFTCGLKGGDGNQEYFVHAEKTKSAANPSTGEPKQHDQHQF
ncbi:MAG TPA: TlyA family RNA methyltransferase [Limnobacter sp.]|nr:TlyA family RNA methyltransferase [Limnobacter sp.]